jgi:hypothetical protein
LGRKIKSFNRKFTAILTLVLFLSQLYLPAWEGASLAWADGVKDLNVRAPQKADVAKEETDDMTGGSKGSKSNVLFLLESTAIMSFTPKGVMPTIVRKSTWFDQSRPQDNIDWDATMTKFGIGLEDINVMMEQATFGMGALPVAMTGGELRRERNLYGRDVDPSNNYVKMSDDPAEDLRLNAEQGRHYYAPFINNGATLVNAYKNQKIPLNIKYEGKDSKTPIPKAWFSVTKDGRLRPDINKIIYNMNGGGYNHETSMVLPYLQGKSVVSNASYNALSGNSLPYALVMHYPAYGGDGWAKTSSYNYQYRNTELVPNDSRMYQAKLVLWRILQEEENRLLKNVRFGLASTFLSLANVTDVSGGFGGKVGPKQENAYDRYDTGGIFKVEPFGGNVHAVDSKYSGTPFRNGILNHGITGNVANWSGIHGQLYPLWMNPPISPLYDPNPALNIENAADPKKIDGLEWNLPAREMYKLLNRASLHVPIADYNHEWTTPDGKTRMSHANKVRMWINGFADIKGVREGWNLSSATDISSFMEPEKRSSQFHFYKDPEIGIAGTFQLPMAIFPNPKISELNRESYIDRGYIWYSAKNSHTNYFGDFRYRVGGESYGDFYIIASPRANYNAGSGEAAGSVLDFFSPPANLRVVNKSAQKQMHKKPVNAIQLALGSKTGNAVDFKLGTSVTARDLDPVSFPIRADCEENWLVVIASGQEMEPITEREKRIAYPSYEAIKNLYEYTSRHPMNTIKRDAKGNPILSGGKVQIEQAAAPTPIKTLVIGIVGDPRKETHAPSKKILEKMRENLTKMARAGVGDDPDDETSLGKPLFAENVDELSEQFRNALIIINESRINQPGKGALLESPVLENNGAASNVFTNTYRIIEMDQWDATLKRYEVSRDANGAMAIREKWELGKNILANRNNRNLRYWRKGAWVPLRPNDSHFGKLTGMSTIDGRMDPGNLKDRTFGGMEPYNALYHWLKGFNYSYATGKLSGRARVLADFGQSGVVLADDPAQTNSLPGYYEWAKNLSVRQAPKLYAQTNDGILHIIDPLNGNEDSAILPPPVLLPSRIATLKTCAVGADKLQWIDDAKSNPSFILDGPLQKRRFDLEQRGDESGWGTYILGTLGRGGNGLYMMDATNHANPSFMWYVENAGGKLITMNKNDSEPKVKSTNLSAGEAAYLNLGFNSPKPAMGVTGALTPTRNLQNFIALPGGTPAEVDLGKNSREGAILLLVDPKDGSLLRAFSGDSMEHPWRIGKKTTGSTEISYMGMMTSEPAIFRSKASPYLAGKIFTADHRGNIYSVLLEEMDSGGKINALSKANWKIRTVATLQKDLATATAAENRAGYVIPHGLAVGVSGNTTWLAGGTADIGVKLTPGTLESGVIENEKQMIFAIKTSENPKAPFARDSLKLLVTSSDILAPSESYEGWYVELAPEKQNNLRGEYVSAKPIIVGGILYVATFTPTGKINTEPTTVCGLVRNVNGASRLYAVDVTSGRGITWKGNEKNIVLEGVKITGLTELKQGGKHSLLVTYDLLASDNNIDNAVTQEQNLSRVTDENGNPLPQLNVVLPSRGGSSTLKAGQTVIQYWFMK